jgi:hypothetical protein
LSLNPSGPPRKVDLDGATVRIIQIRSPWGQNATPHLFDLAESVGAKFQQDQPCCCAAMEMARIDPASPVDARASRSAIPPSGPRDDRDERAITG